MFGYITPLYNELKLGDYYYFKSYYCGLCNTIKENFGNLPRLTLNYDLTFIGFLLDGLSNEPINTKSIHCLKHLTTKTVICQPTNALNYISAVNIIISTLKLKDDIVDDGSIKGRLFYTLFIPADKKAKNHLKSLFSIILVSFTGFVKLGHPQPESNLSLDENNTSPLTMSTYIPSSLLS